MGKDKLYAFFGFLLGGLLGGLVTYQLIMTKRQSNEQEGFALLGAVFQAAQASYQEHGKYAGRLEALGFLPSGTPGWWLFYHSSGDSFRACAVPTDQVNVLMIDAKREARQGETDQCFEVIQKDKGG